MTCHRLHRLAQKTGCTLLLAFIATANTHGQNFKWSTSLDSIATEGFYKIPLPPSITAKLRSDLTDVRILDAKQQEVPYISMAEQPVSYTTLFKEYKILKLEKAKKRTSLTLQNASKNKLNNIHLVIKNADVDKTLRLSGSNDNKEWYVIRDHYFISNFYSNKDHYFISDVYSNAETSVVTIFNFPLTDYQFLKIDISDSLSPPLNILKAGYYDTHSENTKYAECSAPAITQADSAATKATWIKISFPEAQLIDKIDLELSGPKYYLRDCELLLLQERVLKNKKTVRDFIPVTRFNISSNGTNAAYLNAFRSKEFYIRISNNDNPPLMIKAVKCSQINHSLVAWLKKGETYSLVFGDKNVTVPNYDLVNFHDSITAVSALSAGKIELIEVKKKEEEKPAGFFTDNTFIWIALSVVILALGLMSGKMLKETRR